MFLPQKMRNVLKWIFEFMSFICAIFSFWVMVGFVFYLRNELGTWKIFDPENLIQKHKPAIAENQLARGIQSKSIRGLGAETPVGAKPPTKIEGLGDWALLT